MSDLEFRYGSVVIPEDQRESCSALPKVELLGLVHGPEDVTLTYAARQELGRRMASEIVARSLSQPAEQ